MTDEQKELFEKYTDCVREHQTIADCLIFQNSFKLGTRLILEVNVMIILIIVILILSYPIRFSKDMERRDRTLSNISENIKWEFSKV